MAEVKFFKNTEAFEAWFETNRTIENELWVGFYKKHTGIDSIAWSESVDVALCYGWIDGVRKSIDDRSYKIRFTPRNPTSMWSTINIEKVEALIAEGKMKPEGLKLYHARRDKKGYSTSKREVELPQAYEDLIRSNPKAWTFFEALAPSYKKTSKWWIMSAKTEATREKRLKVLIESCENNQKIPMLRK